MKRTVSKSVRQKAQPKVTVAARELEELRGITAALNNAQAIIEYEPDGSVRSANELGLKMLGYTLEEIKGRHQSMYVAASERESAEYRALWERLARGEACTAVARRMRKDGREVWVQA